MTVLILLCPPFILLDQIRGRCPTLLMKVHLKLFKRGLSTKTRREDDGRARKDGGRSGPGVTTGVGLDLLTLQQKKCIG
ncbi:hypothetical protein KKF97_13895 [Myxococcota bacterium]|nr:hypothetical protein [Myxococcota bacterium]